MPIDSEIPLLIEKKSTSLCFFSSVKQKSTGKRSLQQVSLNNMSRSVLMSLIYPPSVKYCEAIVLRQRGCFRNVPKSAKAALTDSNFPPKKCTRKTAVLSDVVEKFGSPNFCAGAP